MVKIELYLHQLDDEDQQWDPSFSITDVLVGGFGLEFGMIGVIMTSLQSDEYLSERNLKGERHYQLCLKYHKRQTIERPSGDYPWGIYEPAYWEIMTATMISSDGDELEDEPDIH